jgi:hypothetical protein
MNDRRSNIWSNCLNLSVYSSKFWASHERRRSTSFSKYTIVCSNIWKRRNSDLRENVSLEKKVCWSHLSLREKNYQNTTVKFKTNSNCFMIKRFCCIRLLMKHSFKSQNEKLNRKKLFDTKYIETLWRRCIMSTNNTRSNQWLSILILTNKIKHWTTY